MNLGRHRLPRENGFSTVGLPPLAENLMNGQIQSTSYLVALRFLLVVFAVAAGQSTMASAAVTQAWEHHFSGVVTHSNDKAVAVARDGTGDIIVAGNSDDGVNGLDMLTIKYSGADGSVLWQRRYNNPAGGVNNSDQITALAVDAQGNVLVTGKTYYQTHGDDWYTAKYAAADGAVIWERFHDPGHLDEPASLAVDSGGNVIVSGSSYSGGTYDTHVIKYSGQDGALMWTRVTPDTRESRSALAVDAGGHPVVTTRSWTAKIAGADGAVVWKKSVMSDGESTLAMDTAGNVVTGSARAADDSGNYYDYLLVMHAAADGARLWKAGITDPETGSNDHSNVTVDGSGNAVVGRTSTMTLSGVTAFHTVKFAAVDGKLIWEQRYRGPQDGIDIAQAVAVDASGNVLVSGASRSYHLGVGYNTDVHTIKYGAADGAVHWITHYDGPAANSDDFPGALLVDAEGDVVVTASSGINAGGPNPLLDYYTVKYRAADGGRLWEKRYNGTATGDDRAQAVAVDSAGNVIVTGYSAHGSLPAYGNDFYTAKYAADTGAPLWERRYDSGSYSFDEATAVVVDPADNVVVTGTSATIKYSADGAISWIKPGSMNSAVAVDAAGNVIVGAGFTRVGEIVTAKLAASDGSLLWAIRRSGDYRYINAVAVDRDANVIVTGASGGNGSLDYYTAKYAAATGALIWERLFDSSYQGQDVATSLAVDAGGNAVVTGTSKKGVSDEFVYHDHDYHTIKYAASDGAILWETRYDSWDSGDDFANAVAVDAAGNVVVTGSSARGEGEWFAAPNSYTAKYAAADGALLWERQDLQGAGSVALGVDGNGDAVITGTRFAGFYTAKYRAADGAKLWSRTISRVGAYASSEMGRWDPLSPNPPGVGDARSLAIGPAGQIAVAGSLDGDSGPEAGYDFATVLYREIPGPASFAAWAATPCPTAWNTCSERIRHRPPHPGAASSPRASSAARSSSPFSAMMPRKHPTLSLPLRPAPIL